MMRGETVKNGVFPDSEEDAIDAIVVYFQSTSDFPSWQEELRERADVNSRSGVQSGPSSNLAKDHENQSCPCHTGHHRERRDRTSSGEVEADKLAGPAHALLSE